MTFKIGDLVQLNSGGEPFTVHDVNNLGVVVTWRDGKKVKFETFQPEQLKLANGPITKIERVIVDPNKRP